MPVAQDVIERGDPVGGDDQEPVADLVNVAHFSAAVAFDAWEIGLQEDWICDGIHDAF